MLLETNIANFDTLNNRALFLNSFLPIATKMNRLKYDFETNKVSRPDFPNLMENEIKENFKLNKLLLHNKN